MILVATSNSNIKREKQRKAEKQSNSMETSGGKLRKLGIVQG